MPEAFDGPGSPSATRVSRRDAQSIARTLAFLEHAMSAVWERVPGSRDGVLKQRLQNQNLSTSHSERFDKLTVERLMAMDILRFDRLTMDRLLAMDIWERAPWAQDLARGNGKTRKADEAAFSRLISRYQHSRKFLYFCAAIYYWQASSHSLNNCMKTAMAQDAHKLEKWGRGYLRMVTSLMAALAECPPEAPTLYRGLRLQPSERAPHQLKAGSVLHLLPQSFSESRGVAADMANPVNGSTPVILIASPGSSALCVHTIGKPGSQFWNELEWVAAGIFTVQKVQSPSSKTEPLVIHITQTGGIRELVEKIRNNYADLRTQV